MTKLANTKHKINDLIRKRWSPRSFSEKLIPRDTILSLFEAACWAASSRNEQPWRFIYGIKGEGANYDKIFDSLVVWNQKWAKSAPLLVLAVTKINSNYHNEPNAYSHYDLGQAVANFAIQATEHNLYIHQMGGFDKVKAKEHFNVPMEYDVAAAIAVGYLGKAEDLPPDMEELELKDRSRLDLSKLIFDGDFKA